MEFGMPTLIEIDDLEHTLKLANELYLPQYQCEELERNLATLKSFKDKYGIYYTIHLDENLNVCDFNNAVREAYLSTVVRTIEIAKQLNIPMINMHMNHGVHFTLPHKKVRLFEMYKDNYLQSVLDFKRLCEKSIGSSNIIISIENTNGYFQYEKEAISLLLEGNVFGLTWDIGHSNAVDNMDEEFIISQESKLTHFHIHDGLNKYDHMTLGTGEIDLSQRLQLAEKNNCRCVVETKTIDSLRKSVKWLRKNGYISLK
jgi:sugar phosphate isomerase/epimerase